MYTGIYVYQKLNYANTLSLQAVTECFFRQKHDVCLPQPLLARHHDFQSNPCHWPYIRAADDVMSFKTDSVTFDFWITLSKRSRVSCCYENLQDIGRAGGEMNVIWIVFRSSVRIWSQNILIIFSMKGSAIYLHMQYWFFDQKRRVTINWTVLKSWMAVAQGSWYSLVTDWSL